MSVFKYVRITDSYHTLDIGEKCLHLLTLMVDIDHIETIRKWRFTYASEKQFKKEYPPEFDKELSMAWVSIKNAYLNDKIAIDEYVKENKMLMTRALLRYYDILQKITDEDLDRILLDGNEDDS